MLTDCPARAVSEATAKKYRRAYDNLRASGLTALEAASTRAHWDFLRTASRFCMETDVRAWRAASERARKRGELESAQRRTERAFRLAAVLDEEFMQTHHRTWTHKAAELKAAGQRPVSKSKRSTRAPPPDMAVGALIGRQERVQERHAERLALLALTGCRPAELQAGVDLSVIRNKRGRLELRAMVKGAKWDGCGRGLQARRLSFPASTGAAAELAARVEARGGQWTLETTAADYRSLNRALGAWVKGASCYSFRHQQGSELKEAIAQGAIAPEEAAAAMGHASTKSLTYYGSRSHARGGRSLHAVASDPVRSMPTTYAAKAAARAARAAKNGAKPQAATPATPAPKAAMTKPAGPLAGGLRPPRR